MPKWSDRTIALVSSGFALPNIKEINTPIMYDLPMYQYLYVCLCLLAL